MSSKVESGSAGTAGYHEGGGADPRTVKTLSSRGVPQNHTARKITPKDFYHYNLILAMDRQNLDDLIRIRPSDGKSRIMLFRDFDPQGSGSVPDPYYGNENDFSEVFGICERTSAEIVKNIISGNINDDSD